jgi:hypothetical protein
LAVRALPSSSTFGRASSSFAAGPWVPSYAQLQAAALSSSITLPEAQNASFSTPVSAKESSKIQSRYLFTDSEIEVLTRNAEEILQLHEHFVRELRVILEPLGFTMDQDQDDSYQHIDNIDAAIRAVSTKFATEVSYLVLFYYRCSLIRHIRLLASTHTNRFVLVIRKHWILSERLCNDFLWNLMLLSSDVRP